MPCAGNPLVIWMDKFLNACIAFWLPSNMFITFNPVLNRPQSGSRLQDIFVSGIFVSGIVVTGFQPCQWLRLDRIGKNFRLQNITDGNPELPNQLFFIMWQSQIWRMPSWKALTKLYWVCPFHLLCVIKSASYILLFNMRPLPQSTQPPTITRHTAPDEYLTPPDVATTYIGV